MLRAGALVSLFAMGCAGATAKPDAAALPDFGDTDASVPPDLSMAQDLSRVYQTTTVREIDTGTIPAGTAVAVSGVVMTTPVGVRTAAGSSCTYQAWVQDPLGPPPSGLQIFVALIASPCPPPGGPFVGRAQGDNLIVRGVLVTQSFPGDGSSALAHHSIAVDTLTPSGGNATITALTLDDPSLFRGTGPGFQSYEGMLVSLGCGTGAACTSDGNLLKVTFQPAPYLWGVTGGALFGSAFSAAWPGKPGINQTAYARIVGVANTFLTGSLEPRAAADFVP